MLLIAWKASCKVKVGLKGNKSLTLFLFPIITSNLMLTGGVEIINKPSTSCLKVVLGSSPQSYPSILEF